ncbi:unnamed protein product [Citrullus colocynthis]|uniref:Uncharacterized protein n=1 Tax=Citrullus colocynthis TaxID=252529 RepID=A0ABP0XNB1_9ROSI
MQNRTYVCRCSNADHFSGSASLPPSSTHATRPMPPYIVQLLVVGIIVSSFQRALAYCSGHSNDIDSTSTPSQFPSTTSVIPLLFILLFCFLIQPIHIYNPQFESGQNDFFILCFLVQTLLHFTPAYPSPISHTLSLP